MTEDWIYNWIDGTGVIIPSSQSWRLECTNGFIEKVHWKNTKYGKLLHKRCNDTRKTNLSWFTVTKTYNLLLLPNLHSTSKQKMTTWAYIDDLSILSLDNVRCSLYTKHDMTSHNTKKKLFHLLIYIKHDLTTGKSRWKIYLVAYFTQINWVMNTYLI